MAALSRGCKPRIQSTLGAAQSTFSPTRPTGENPGNEVAAQYVFIDLILLCFPRQHWIRGGGERFFIWNQCAFSSGQPKNVRRHFCYAPSQILFEDCNTLIDFVNSLYEIVFVYWLILIQKH